MASLNALYYQQFLLNKDYDLRKSQNGRWLDQKCTPDVIATVVDCILVYLNRDFTKEFTVKDIKSSAYSKYVVEHMYKKPSTDENSARREYDKFFGQPMKLLEYSGVLTSWKQGNTNIYKVSEAQLLEYLVTDKESLPFLCQYIRKVLQDSAMYSYFLRYLREQTKDSFEDLKEFFDTFTIENTGIKGKLECHRIFSKVLNPLAFESNRKGVIDGRMSKDIICMDDLKYNRANFQDKDKPKNLTRQQHKEELGETEDELQDLHNLMDIAKKEVKAYNKQHKDGLTEVYAENELHCTGDALVIHHMFPRGDKPELMAVKENLICITPNQHYTLAHPNNHTARVDKAYQYLCLKSKLDIVEQCETVGSNVYSRDTFVDMLNVGLDTDRFSNSMSYIQIAHTLHSIYKGYLSN